jgi:TRAP-type C4-dicarboxylate transport system permease small subunit
MAWVQKVRRGFEIALNFLIGLLMTGMVLVVFSNVIFRYFLNAALAWSDEVSRFMLIWLVFLGAVIAYMRNDHLGLDILLKYLPPVASRWLVVLADFLVLFILVIMTQGGINMTTDSFSSGWVSAAVSMPFGFVYMVAPISSILMILEGLLKTTTDMNAAIHYKKGGK